MARQATTSDATLQRRIERRVDAEIERLLSELGGDAPLLARMACYHLGLIEADGTPTTPEDRPRLQGKRFRPLVAVTSCLAAGGEIDHAVPLAAAIELLHNFTLIHDDIQDRSPNRRHRPTVWNLWGDAQAINAGDAVFAAAQIGVLGTDSPHLPFGAVAVIARAFNRMTIDIVRGQVLDLGFEGRNDITPHAYLGMIRGKTAAIVAYAAWAGSTLGGAAPEIAHAFADFGQALGLGFQVRDDALGVWGSPEETGKDTADDIRRRKQSLPVITLRSRADAADAATVDAIFGRDRLSEDDVAAVLGLFDRYEIRLEVETHVRRYHDDAAAALARIPADGPALDVLRDLTARLALRVT